VETEFLNYQQDWHKQWERFTQSVGGLSECQAELELSLAPSTQAEAQVLFESLCNDFGDLSWDRAELSRQLEQYTREERRWEWLAGRVLQARIKKKIQQNQIHPKVHLSLSHTTHGATTYLVAVGLGMSEMTSDIFGVGIDLESSTRKISDEVFHRVTTDSERTRAESMGLDPLDLWVQKEAAFKATPENVSSVITQYELLSWDTHLSLGVIHSSGLQAQQLQAHTTGIFDGPWKLGMSFSASGSRAR
jgi:4'-phosphopantetheinyl transferase EntD